MSVDGYAMQLAPLATSLSKLNMYPYFDVIHYVLMCLLFRKDETKDLANAFSRKHIVGSWFGSLLLCFSGSMVSNFLIGEPLVTPFKYHENVVFATIAWYLINYSPSDLIYKILNSSFMRIVLNALWCLYIVNKIQSGVLYGAKHFAKAHLIIIVLGIAKGAGHLFMNCLLKVVKGTYKDQDHEILFPSFHTKCCFLASLLFCLQHYNYIPVQHPPFLFAVLVLFFTYTNLSNYLLGEDKGSGGAFFNVVENIFCLIFFTNPLLTKSEEEENRSNNNEEEEEEEEDVDDNEQHAIPKSSVHQKMKKN